MLECGTMYISYVDAVYKTLIGNPDPWTGPYQGALDCLHREKVAPKTYSQDDLKHDLRDASSQDEFITSLRPHPA